MHAASCERYEGPGVPPDLRALPLLVEAFGAGGEPLGRERVRDQPAEEVLERLLAVPAVEYLHIRNLEAGCFMARVDRA